MDEPILLGAKNRRFEADLCGELFNVFNVFNLYANKTVV